MTMVMTAQYAVHSVFMAFALTSLSCFGVVLFATITKKDLTSMIGILFIATMCLMGFGFVVIIVGIFTDVRILFVVYAAIGAFLFMIWLAVDVQMIMGGRTYGFPSLQTKYGFP
uniref:Protein lifeguard 3 n=1 Tax=Globodera pallida TaxID=36090 RepID=A0A183BXL4_GLOPA